MSNSLDVGIFQSDKISVGPFQNAATAGLTINQNENFNFLDSEIVVLGLLLSFSDQLSLSDSIGLVSGGITISDQFTFFDDVIVVLNDFYIFSDTISLSDDESIVPSISLIFNDEITLTDSIIVQLFFALSIQLFESFFVGTGYWIDSIKIFTSNPLITQDQLVFQDFIQLSSQYFNAYNDQLQLQDSVQILLAPIANLLQSDQIMLSDAITVTAPSIFTPLNYAFTDQLQLVDGSDQLLSPLALSMSDMFSLGDSIIVLLSTDLNSYLRRYLNDVVGIGNP